MVMRAALPVLPYREPEIIRSCRELDRVFKKEQIKSVLIATDQGIVSHRLTASVEAVLANSSVVCTIYDKTQPNPTASNVDDALTLYRAHGCDSLIAIGGGSSMDCAKAVGARVAHPKKSLQQMKGILRVLRPLPTLIAIPTTAGTGSEVTLAADIPELARHAEQEANPLYPVPKLMDTGELETIYHKIADWSVEQ